MYANRLMKSGMLKNILLILIFFVGCFFIPDCFVSRHVTTGMLGVAIITILYALAFVRMVKVIKITPLFLWVFLYSIFWLMYQFFYSALAWHDWIGYISFLLLFFIVSQQEFGENELRQYYFIGSMAGMVMGTWGLLQYFELVQAYYTSVPVTGSFENPAGLAIFLSGLLPCSLYFTRERKMRYKMWGIVTSLLAIWVILLSNSRTGILIMIVLCILYVCQNISFPPRHRFVNKFLFLGIVLFLFVGLYFWKKDSADGRMLIWLCSLDMFGDHWFFGIGSGKFQAEYMLYQADFFQWHPDSMFMMLADNVNNPFNEYLKVLVEYGIIGFSMVVMILVHLVKVCKANRDKVFLFPVFGCILAVMLAACFSYPLNYPSIVLIFVFSVAIVNSCYFSVWKVKKRICVKGVAVGLVVFSLLFSRIVYCYGRSEYEWCKAARFSLEGRSEEMLPSYKEIYDWMRRDGLFLYNYGAELYQVKRYSESLKILKECASRFNDEDVQQILAKDYIQLGMYSEAKECLLLAAAMCPVRFVPLYELMNLHLRIKDFTEAKRYARIIIDKPVKINSSRIRKIKKAAKVLLE